MLPENIVIFLQKVCKKTEQGELKNWTYDSLNGFVENSIKNTEVKVTRSFDEIKELNFYRVEINDNKGKSAIFLTYDGEDGYVSSEKLYNEAMASTLDLDIEG